MAGDDTTLPQLQPVSDFAARRAARRSEKPIAPVASSTGRDARSQALIDASPWAAIYDNLAQIDNPMGREVARLSIQEMFRDRTGDRSLTIPREEDYLRQQEENAIAYGKLRVEGAKQRVAHANAAMEGASSELQAHWGFRPGLLEEDPDSWLASIQNAAAETGADMITKEDLILASDQPEIVLDAGKRAEEALASQRKELSAQAGALADMESIGKIVGDTMQGKTQLAAEIGAEQQAVETAYSTISESHVDEPRGAQGLLALRAQLQNKLGAKGGKQNIAQIFLSKYGAIAKDAIEEIPDIEGAIQPGEGNAWVDKDASYYLSALTLGLAEDQGTTGGPVLAQMGVSGGKTIDVARFLAETHRRFKGKEIQAMKEMGLSSMLSKPAIVNPKTGEITTYRQVLENWGD